jgi:hypothetical protein
MTDDVTTFPDDSIKAGDQTDPNTGATVSADGGAVVFPDQRASPSDSPTPKELDHQVAPYIPGGPTVDPATGATVSGDGSNIVFPDQNINPPAPPSDMPTFPTPDTSTPSRWDAPTPDPANDPIFGPGGAGPDPQGPDF